MFVKGIGLLSSWIIMIFIYFYFDLATSPFILKGYVAKERKDKRKPAPGELQQSRSSALSGVLCASPGVRVPLTKEI
jgi:hypothetical protein